MSHTVTVKLYNLDHSESADISSIALEKSLKRRLNSARQFTVTVPAAHPLVTDVFGDDVPAMNMGDRVLYVEEDGEPAFHGRVQVVEHTGDGLKNRAVITAMDPWMELGYDADDRAGRPVRDATGNFISPVFNSGGPISGGDLVEQILTNSQGTDSEGGANPGEGPLPIDLTLGTFDTSIGPAVDLSPVAVMDWPVLIGDFFQTLIQTNVLDIEMTPLKPADAPDPYQTVACSAVNSFGTDRSGTVHFDYWTGSKNAKACRHVADFATINNKLYDYLGPRIDQNHWRTNITPGSSGTLVDPTDSRARYGTFMSIRAFDTVGDESSAAEIGLYIALWNAEQGLRIEPRKMLFLTPSPDAKALFEAGIDFDVGDLIAVNTGGAFGLSLSEAQRVYGYDVEWNTVGTRRVSELLTSADAA